MKEYESFSPERAEEVTKGERGAAPERDALFWLLLFLLLGKGERSGRLLPLLLLLME